MKKSEPYYETKIGRIIEENFDSRVQGALFSYILDNGISRLSKITEEQIMSIKGNPMMTTEFVQALVRCSAEISKQCTTGEIMDYIKNYV